jgi:hypothetical protein
MRVWVVVVVSLSGAEKPPTVVGVYQDELTAIKWKEQLERTNLTIAVTVCESELS